MGSLAVVNLNGSCQDFESAQGLYGTNVVQGVTTRGVDIFLHSPNANVDREANPIYTQYRPRAKMAADP